MVLYYCSYHQTKNFKTLSGEYSLSWLSKFHLLFVLICDYANFNHLLHILLDLLLLLS